MNDRSETIKRAIFNMGGPKIASSSLGISTSTVNKWIRNGVIPNLYQATQVSEASGFDIGSLRPRFKQTTF